MRLAAMLVATLSMAACGGGSKSPGPGTGTGWTLVDTTLRYGNDIVAVGSRLVASGEAPIVVSDDDGMTWNLSNAGLPLHAPAFDLVARRSTVATILADTSDGLYESRDNGANWSCAPQSACRPL